MQHVEAHHDHPPHVVVQRARQHRIGEIVDRVLREADVPDLALHLLFNERRRDDVACMLVLVRLHPVQIEHIDIVGAHRPQRIVETFDHARRRPPLVAAVDGRLGRNEHLLAGDGFQRPPHHAFRAIGWRRVDDIDAQPKGLLDQPRRLRLGLPGLQAEPAEAAGAEACDADAEAGAAEGGVIHGRLSCFEGGLCVSQLGYVLTNLQHPLGT